MPVRLPKFKKVLCIFAHPDDESFGPGGTLSLFAKQSEVGILCVTDGNNPGVLDDLTMTRHTELQTAANVLGIQHTWQWDYADGHLCNAVYHEIAEKLQSLIRDFQPELLLTFEPQGISGHLDHIALSMITTYVFNRTPQVKELWYYCISDTQSQLEAPEYFIHFPDGYKRTEVDRIIDITSVWDQRCKAMNQHISQIKDAKKIQARLEPLPKEEWFIVRTR